MAEHEVAIVQINTSSNFNYVTLIRPQGLQNEYVCIFYNSNILCILNMRLHMAKFGPFSVLIRFRLKISAL